MRLGSEMLESNNTEERLMRVESVLRRLKRASAAPQPTASTAVKVLVEVAPALIARPLLPFPRH